MTFIKTTLRNLGIAGLLAAGIVVFFTSDPAKAQTGIPITDIFKGEAPAKSLEDLLREMYLIEGRLEFAEYQFEAIDDLRTELLAKRAVLAVKEADLAVLERLAGQVQEVVPDGGTPLATQVTELKADIRTLELVIRARVTIKAQAEAARDALDQQIVRAAAEQAKVDIEALIEARIAAAEENILWDDKNQRIVEMAAELDATTPVVEAVVIDCINFHPGNLICSDPAVMAAIEAYEADMAACEHACKQPIEEEFREGQHAAGDWDEAFREFSNIGD